MGRQEMNSVGHIGQRVGAPKAETINQALALLAIFGGGDQRVRDMLVELQAAATHNETLIAQFEGLERREADVARREREVSEAESRIDAKFARIRAIRDELHD